MKLELKHIAGYLPYGLKYKDIPEGYDEVRTLCINTMDWCLYNGKPILRPLSDLIKEIEVNGEKFVPIKKLGWEYYDGELGSITNCVYGESPKTTVNVMDYLYDLEQLYEWHFDLHSLIEKGLAVNINTIDNGIQ